MSDDEPEQFSIPRLPGGKIDMNMREQILSRFMEGYNKADIAAEFKVSSAAVRNIIKSHENADKVRNNKIDYDVKERTRVLNKAFCVVDSMIERCSDEFRMKALAETLNTLIHTKRIEEGLSGASIQDKPFIMEIKLNDDVQKFVDKDDFPELSAGDMTVDVNPEPAHQEAIEQPVYDDLTIEQPVYDDLTKPPIF